MAKGKLLVVTLMIFFLYNVRLAFTEEIPQISVDPLSVSIYVNQTFSVNITIKNVVDLNALDIKLRYDTNVLDALHIIVFPPWPANHTSINDAEGCVWMNSTLTSPNGLSGNITIAQVTFKGISQGTSILSLAETMMLTSSGEVIAFIRKDGKVNVSIYMIKVPYDYPTIQEAINAAKSGDTVFVYQGTYYERIVVNKTIRIQAENLNTIIDGGNGDCAINITAPNVILINFTIRNSTIGLNIVSDGNLVQGNIFTNHEIGVKIVQTNNNKIFNNTITHCETALFISHSTYIHVMSNIASLNNYGIIIEDAHFSIVENNKVLDNTYGIQIKNSTNDKITRNKLLNNQNGLILINATNNWILRNNFASILLQLSLKDSTSNTWDNGVEGNYWSDYYGKDLNGDGIGDTDLPHHNVDSFPLIHPYISGDINHDRSVDSSDLGMLGLSWGTTPLMDVGWNPACDLNEDDVVDSTDLGVMGINWGVSV